VVRDLRGWKSVLKADPTEWLLGEDNPSVRCFTLIDVLEILGILTKLGYHDQRMQEAIDLVVSKQDDLGRWRLERSFNGRFQVNIEQEDKPSKWITLKALTLLKRFYVR